MKVLITIVSELEKGRKQIADFFSDNKTINGLC